MAFAQGTAESIVIGPEASFKTLPGTVNGWLIPVESPTATPDKQTFQPNSLTGQPEPRGVAHGKFTVPAGYNLECNPASVVPTFKGFFAGETLIGGMAVAKPVYPHRFHLANPIPPYFREQRHTDITVYELLKGFYHGQLMLKFTDVGFMSAQVSGRAGEVAYNGATVAAGTVIDCTGYLPFDYINTRFKKGGTTIGYAKSQEITIDRKLVEATAQDQTQFLAAIGSEIPTVNGRITTLFTSDVILADALDGDQTSIEIWLPYENGFGLLVELPSLKPKPGAITTQGTGFNEVNFAFDAYGLSSTGIPGRVWSGYWTTATLVGLSLDTKTLIVSGDGGADETFTFQAGDTTMDLLAARINATAIRVIASVDRMPGDTGGVLRIQSLTSGSTSTVQVQAASTADALLGFVNTSQAGLSGKSIVATAFSPLSA